LTDAAFDELTGNEKWTWTASMEAYDSYPRADLAGGQVPNGRYRFVIDGHIHTGGSAKRYHLVSRVFKVSPWRGIKVSHLHASSGLVTFHVAPIRYPRLPIHVPAALRRFYSDNGGGLGKPDKSVLCATCSFEPWASVGHVKRATLYVVNTHGRVLRTVHAHQLNRDLHIWAARLWLKPGQRVVLPRGGIRDTYGETNRKALAY
jgi:hypothetical protein